MSPVAEAPNKAVDKEEGKKFLSREDWLNQAGLLAEEEHYVEGLGWLLLSEISGDARADIVGRQSVGLLAESRRIDAKDYQRSLLLAGVVDPGSPKGDRRPMFRPGDMDKVMRVGGAKIADVVDAIERLSALGGYQGAAEGNSDSIQSGAGTSV